MPHQQNPERRTDGAVPGADRSPRNPGQHTATPDAPQLPRQRRATPVRPPQHATPPGGRPATPAGRGTPPGGVRASTPGRPPRPTQVMPGPGVPEVPVAGAGPVRPVTARTASAMQGNVPTVGRREDPPGGGPAGRGPGGAGHAGRGPGGGSRGDGSAGGKDEKPTSDLNVSRVVAGAGAAVVTAILGSFLGAVGTVLGAALGSIITTVATTFFQRSLEHTKTKVTGTTQRLKERRTESGGAAVWQQAAAQEASGRAGADGQETVLLDPSAAGSRPTGRGRRRMTRKQIVFAAVGAGLAFVLAMFLVTGIEWIKGGTITGGGSGTSIGNVVSGTSTQPTKQDDTGDSSPASERSTSTSESDPSTSSSDNPSPTSENGTDENGSDSRNPLDGRNGVLPSQQPESGQLQSGPDGGGDGSGGAASTN